MSQTKSFVLLAGAALSFGAAQAQTVPTTVNKDEIRAIVAEVMSDAETRSSLLAGGAVAGHDGKFFLASADGNFRLNIGGMIQFRYILNFRDNSNATDADGVDGGNSGDDFDPGFQTRRTKLYFDGHIVNPNWFYAVNLNFSKGLGNEAKDNFASSGVNTSEVNGFAFLEDAYAGYNFGNGWKAQWGQFKIPLLREELVSDNRQLAAERSTTNSAFTQGWSQGIQVSLKEEDWRFAVAFSDGLQSQNTDFTNFSEESSGTIGSENPPFIVRGEADYAFTGRFEYKFAGAWDDFDDFTARAGQPFSCMVGAAGHFQQSPDSNFLGDIDRSTFEYTIDGSFEGDAWNLYGAFIGRHDELQAAGASPSNDDFGVIIQGGFRFSDTEIFARWDAIFPDSNRNLDHSTYDFITVGVNQYYAGHAAKATIDAVFAVQSTNDIAGVAEVSGPGPHGFIGLLPNTGSGLLGSNKSGEVAVRFQFQLLF